MRFMMFMIPNNDAEAGAMPTAEMIDAMTRYNDELSKAGVLLALDGLQPSSRGARVSFAGGRPTVKDGPFTEAKEVIGGYWMIQVKSKEEAVQWATRVPAEDGNVIELRQVFELEDFGDAVTPESRETLDRLQAQLSQP
jgi:hypothetical protein